MKVQKLMVASKKALSILKLIGPANEPPTPSGIFGLRLEILYFFAFAYNRVLPNFGLYAGSGSAGLFMMILAAVILIVQIKRMPFLFVVSILFPIMIAGSIWIIVLLFHPGFLRSETFFMVGDLGKWVAETIIISYLIRRPGFIKRLIMVMFVSVILVLPFAIYVDDVVKRLKLSTNGFLANSNDLAAWLGFCTIGLLMWAFSVRSLISKALLALSAAFCLYLIALTVSRTSLSLTAGVVTSYIALQLFSRKRMLSAIATIFIGIVIIILFVSASNVGESLVNNFTARLSEDTGRNRLWEESFPLVVNNPLGLGTTVIHDPIYLDEPIGPHNILLYFGLIAGYLPLFMTLLYYIVAGLSMRKIKLYDGFLWIPGLFIYTLFQHFQSNEYIFEIWSIAALCLCLYPLADNRRYVQVVKDGWKSKMVQPEDTPNGLPQMFTTNVRN